MQEPLWVFGYGSLIWNPEFEVAEQVVARASGWHRSFCMRSLHYRGTPERMGLVLALDRAAPGVFCDGVAFRVPPGQEAQTLAALRARELGNSAYREDWLEVAAADGRCLTALAYVIEPAHALYCGGLALEVQAAIIARAVGERGPNREYLFATARHLTELGIADADLDRLVTLVRELHL